jgi:hypothetical protein
MNRELSLADKSSIEIELNKLNGLKRDFDLLLENVKSSEFSENLVEEIMLLERSLKKEILRRKIQLRLIDLEKHMKVIDVLKEKLYNFYEIRSKFLERLPEIREGLNSLSDFNPYEVTDLPSSDEIQEKLYEIKARYLELINNEFVGQERSGKS